MSLKVVVKSATTSATTCGCIHWTYIFYSLEQAPGTEAHFSSEAALSTWWYPLIRRSCQWRHWRAAHWAGAGAGAGGLAVEWQPAESDEGNIQPRIVLSVASNHRPRNAHFQAPISGPPFQAPPFRFISIGIVRGVFPLAMGVASETA